MLSLRRCVSRQQPNVAADCCRMNVEQATENRQQGMKGEDIARRLLRFAVHVLRLVRELQRDSIGRHVARQLLRSSTAGGANYEEARSAESRADFAHKVGIAAKEVRQSRYWLRLSAEASNCSAQRGRGSGRRGGRTGSHPHRIRKDRQSSVMSPPIAGWHGSAISVRVLGCLLHIPARLAIHFHYSCAGPKLARWFGSACRARSCP